MTDVLNIALAQVNFLVGDVEGNAQLIVDHAIRARDEHAADMVVFSELAVTGYPLEDLLFRPSLMRRVEKAVHMIHQNVKDIYILLGAPTKVDEELFNSALLIYNAKTIAQYHKHKLPNYEVFDEKRYFSTGHSACVVNFKGIQLGITICEDIWFPEPIQKSKQAGAELSLIHI